MESPDDAKNQHHPAAAVELDHAVVRGRVRAVREQVRRVRHHGRRAVGEGLVEAQVQRRVGLGAQRELARQSTLAFETNDRPNRMAKLQKSGAHVVVAEPRWPGFFELAKREKPYAIAIDFSEAPSHALETADYMSKAKETKETALFLLRVPSDRVEPILESVLAAEGALQPRQAALHIQAGRLGTGDASRGSLFPGGPEQLCRLAGDAL